MRVEDGDLTGREMWIKSWAADGPKGREGAEEVSSASPGRKDL